MKQLYKIVDAVSTVLAQLAGVIFVLILLTVVVNVVGRRLFSFTVPGIMEIVCYGMLVVMTLAMARTTFSGGHVAVTMFTEKLPKGAQKAVSFLALLVASALVALAAYMCATSIPVYLANHQNTDYFKIPFYMVYIFMTFGLGISCLMFLVNAFLALFPVKKDQGPAPGATETPEQ